VCLSSLVLDTIKAEGKSYGLGEVITAFCRHEAVETNTTRHPLQTLPFAVAMCDLCVPGPSIALHSM
jgi:hypothetical protein